ncbi:MAG: alkaline phosphatase family protein [Allorhizobium sp.]|uniref:alkaline phosphatase family protein n=1 Tax=Allorhizobium sp. TaxID=633478 RepID=UPI004033EB7C
MRKVILIVLDGLRYDVARTCLGYMEGLVAAGRADVRMLTCELPAMSRPLYETLLTGRRPVDHGVVSNGVVRRSVGDNLFGRVRAQERPPLRLPITGSRNSMSPARSTAIATGS